MVLTHGQHLQLSQVHLEECEYDLIITGRQAIDGDTAQVGPQIAEHLNLPIISYAEDIKVEGDSVVVKTSV